MNNKFYEGLRGILCDEAIFLSELMSEHTSFKIGGKCEFFVELKNTDELKAVSALCKAEEVPFLVIGKGSNLLAPDEGVKGVVAVLSGDFLKTEITGNMLKAGAGAAIGNVTGISAAAGLAGLEFAGGIPGSVGGAVIMNAGAYGGEIKDVITKAEVFADGEVKVFTKEELRLSYRHSIIQDMDGAVVISATFFLSPDEPELIKERISDFNSRRREKQPLSFPSAGSTFKRPEGAFAAKLIDEAGLRGFRIGGAEVSTKHCGFVINAGGATADDVKKLIVHVRNRVEEKSGIRLEPEVKIL